MINSQGLHCAKALKRKSILWLYYLVIWTSWISFWPYCSYFWYVPLPLNLTVSDIELQTDKQVQPWLVREWTSIHFLLNDRIRKTMNRGTGQQEGSVDENNCHLMTWGPHDERREPIPISQLSSDLHLGATECMGSVHVCYGIQTCVHICAHIHK